MKISFWNQHFEHKETIFLPRERIFAEVVEHYKLSSKGFNLEKENYPKSFIFNRGSILMSAFGLGSELWFKHHVIVSFEEIKDKETQITWKINLKVFGLQAGSNAIIKECKKIAKNFA